MGKKIDSKKKLIKKMKKYADAQSRLGCQYVDWYELIAMLKENEK